MIFFGVSNKGSRKNSITNTGSVWPFEDLNNDSLFKSMSIAKYCFSFIQKDQIYCIFVWSTKNLLLAHCSASYTLYSLHFLYPVHRTLHPVSSAHCILHTLYTLSTLHSQQPVPSPPCTNLQSMISYSPTPFQILNFIQSVYCKLDLLIIKVSKPPNQWISWL